MGVEEGRQPLFINYFPSPLIKGRGIKGEGLANNINENDVERKGYLEEGLCLS